MDDGQPDSGAFELLGVVQALEDLEELGRVVHVESDSVVPHEISGDVLLLARPDLNSRPGRLAGELQGVAHEVGEHLPEQRPVTGRRGQVREFDDDRRFPETIERFSNDGLGELAHVNV